MKHKQLAYSSRCSAHDLILQPIDQGTAQDAFLVRLLLVDNEARDSSGPLIFMGIGCAYMEPCLSQKKGFEALAVARSGPMGPCRSGA